MLLSSLLCCVWDPLKHRNGTKNHANLVDSMLDSRLKEWRMSRAQTQITSKAAVINFQLELAVVKERFLLSSMYIDVLSSMYIDVY